MLAYMSKYQDISCTKAPLSAVRGRRTIKIDQYPISDYVMDQYINGIPYEGCRVFHSRLTFKFRGKLRDLYGKMNKS